MERKDNKGETNTSMIVIVVAIIMLAIGAVFYFSMNGKNEVEDAIEDTGNAVENIIENDNNEKTMTDVVGNYQAKVGATLGVDEDTTADTDDYIELILSEDGNAQVIFTKDSKDVINGTYIVEDSHVIITSSDKTYKFKINDNDTLSYMNGLADVELNKVDASELKYIK